MLEEIRMDVSRYQAQTPGLDAVRPAAAVDNYKVNSTSKGSGATGGSTYQVSDQARELSHLAKLAREAPDVRQDRVDAVRAKIDSGEYKVDLEKLADHLSQVLEP